MKNKILTLILFLPLILSARDDGDHKTIVLYDAALKSSELKQSLYMGSELLNGALVEVDFTSMNCDSLGLRIGYGFTPSRPFFYDTIPGYSAPLILDKNIYAEDYEGVQSNALLINIPSNKGDRIWTEIKDATTCTSGQVILRLK